MPPLLSRFCSCLASKIRERKGKAGYAYFDRIPSCLFGTVIRIVLTDVPILTLTILKVEGTLVILLLEMEKDGADRCRSLLAGVCFF